MICNEKYMLVMQVRTVTNYLNQLHSFPHPLFSLLFMYMQAKNFFSREGGKKVNFKRGRKI